MRTSRIGHASGTRGAGLAAAALVVATAGCIGKQAPDQHFYDQHIQPIFNNFCVGNTSPCHKIDPVTKTALGNLDLTSFANVQKRRDALRTYGSYPQPLLLLKALNIGAVQIPYRGTLVPSEIKHAGGNPIAPNSDAYYQLKRWLDAGANIDGVAAAPVARQGVGSCNSGLPPASQRIAVDTTKNAYQTFVSTIEPFFLATCAYGTCHSSPQADFYLTCSGDPDHDQFNYAQAAGFIALAGTPIEQSEVLLRPLSPQAGGVSHTGGIFFTSRMDPTWVMLQQWALDVQANNPNPPLTLSTGEQFFVDNVMPKLLARGCALEGCHSPDGFNDFRLRSGAQGFFAPLALRRNYHALLDEFMALDSVDVKQSRAVKKNIDTHVAGITHRAGPILEDMAPATDPCPQPFDPTTNTRAVCVLTEWHRLERMAAAGNVSAMPATIPLAYVSRPPNPDDLLHFDTYRGGADLKLADAAVDATGAVTGVANVRSALTSCAGLAGQDVDVRGPEWSYDGSKLVFAARPGATSGLDLWLLDMAGGTCRQLTSDAGRPVNGVPIHNFDPVFAPDGSLVFASTRAGTLTLKTFQPNSDLWRVDPSLDFSMAQQMTFLLNSELSPAFMQDGRVSFTAEKASPEFYQLSGRRINWDLTDYHPLLAQRAQSTDTFSTALEPSVNYSQATEIREGLDRNFLIILSDVGAQGGGGALATFNRSIGPFQAGRDDMGTFVKSVVIIDQAATGKAGTAGVYRSPFSLPNGEIMASYASNVTDPTNATPQYDLVAVNPIGGARRTLQAGGGQAIVEAVLGYKRAERLLFTNTPQLVFGGHPDQPNTGTDAVMHFPDTSVLATLLGANLRSGRNFEAMDAATALKAYVEQPPPSANPGNLSGSQMTYTNRMAVGTAPLESDHSLKVLVPAGVPLILELVDGNGNPVFTMSEEHQVSAGEYITPGPPRTVFNNICGGCHGSLGGSELDVSVSADALTGATVSASRDMIPKSFQ
jgi:hypothetical protein